MADTNALQAIQIKTNPGGAYNNTVTNYQIEISDQRLAVVFMVPEDCNITGMCCYSETVYGTSPAYQLALQGVLDDSPKPDGTTKGSGTAKADFTPSASGTREHHDLDTPYAASGGELLSGVLQYLSGTIDSGNKVQFTQNIWGTFWTTLPVSLQQNTGGYWNVGVDKWPVITCTTDLGYDIGGIFNIGPGTSALSTLGHRWAMRIEIPADEAIELHVEGFRYIGGGPGGGYADKRYKAAIWDDAGDEIVSITIDSDQGDLSQIYWSREYMFTETATLESGEIYYCGFEETGDDLEVAYAQVVHADGLRSWPGGDIFTAATWNGSAWTEDQTRRPIIDLILSSLHGVGGGGSTTRPTMGVIG